MKKIKLLTTLMLMLLFSNESAFSNPIADGAKTTIGDDVIGAIRKVVIQQLEGSAARDIQKMKSVLHDNFRIVVNDPAKGPIVMDRNTMLSLYEKGRFGGEVKPIEIISVDVVEGLNATVKVREVGAKAVFNWYISLIKTDQEWKIISELAFVKPIQ